MIDPENVPPVTDAELLARYVTTSRHFRSSDNTVKQDLFMPHPYIELSVTRHLDATESEVWEVGIDVVADQTGRTLYGRTDIQACDCNIDSLQVAAKPILPKNPNHADIEGWPSAKQDQKLIALKLAASASKLIPPPKSENISPADVEVKEILTEVPKSDPANNLIKQVNTTTRKLDIKFEGETKETFQQLDNKYLFTGLVAVTIGGFVVAIVRWLFMRSMV
jgi:hypothetical protein